MKTFQWSVSNIANSSNQSAPELCDDALRYFSYGRATYHCRCVFYSIVSPQVNRCIVQYWDSTSQAGPSIVDLFLDRKRTTSHQHYTVQKRFLSTYQFRYLFFSNECYFFFMLVHVFVETIDLTWDASWNYCELKPIAMFCLSSLHYSIATLSCVMMLPLNCHIAKNKKCENFEEILSIFQLYFHFHYWL